MKKNILHIFASTVLLISLFASCSFLDRDLAKEEPKTYSAESQMVKVSGSLGKTLSRAAVPTMPDGTYYVKATDSNGSTVNGKINDSNNTYEILLSSEEDWTLEAGLKNASNIPLLKQSDIELTSSILMGKKSYALNFTLAPVSTETGTVNLSVILPDDSYTLKVECINADMAEDWGTVSSLEPTEDIDGNWVVNINKSDITSGVYSVMLSLIDSSNTAVGHTQQKINVYDNLETNKWIGTSNITDSDGRLNIKATINKFNQNIFYVGTVGEAVGNDDTGEGTPYKPFATIAKAVNMMDDDTKDYIIYVSGMLGRTNDTSALTAGQFIAEVEAEEYTTDNDNTSWKYVHKEPIQAKSITLMGLNPLEDGKPVDGIDTQFDNSTNGKATPVLLVATSVPVTLKNIKLSGGYLKPGYALAVGGSYRDTNNENVDVPANVTIKDGVLITDNNKGSESIPDTSGGFAPMVVITGSGSVCKMEGGSITDNYAGLGLVSVGRETTFEMTGGSITGNHLYTYDSSRSKSCGVYVVAPAEDGSLGAGIFKISGDAVVDEIYLNTGAVVTIG